MADERLDYTNIDQPYNSLMEKINGDMTAIKNGTGVLGQSYFNIGTSVGNVSDASQLSVDSELNQVTSPSQLRGGTVANQSFNNIWLTNWMKSTNYQAKARGFYIDGTRGYIECTNIYAKGGIVVGSIDIPDTTSSNSFHTTSAGNSWWGASLAAGYAAAPAYILATGVARFEDVFIGAVGRTGDAIANAINSSSQLVGDINIAAKLNTVSQAILADFNFGTTNWAGAVKAGSISWNVGTGDPLTVTGSGVAVWRNGIVGANSGVITFTIDATTGDATFAGTVTAAAGYIGRPVGGSGGWTINTNTISSTNISLTSGVANAANITVGTGSTAGGLNSAAAGGDVVFWAGDTFANRGSAIFRVYANGNVFASNITLTGYITIGGALADVQGSTNYLSDIKTNMGTITSGSFQVASSIQIRQSGGTSVGYLGQDPGATGIWGFIAERGYGLMCRYTGNNYFRIYMDSGSTDAVIDMPSPDTIKIQDNGGAAVARFHGNTSSAWHFTRGLDMFGVVRLYQYNGNVPDASGSNDRGTMYYNTQWDEVWVWRQTSPGSGIYEWKALAWAP